MSEEIVSAATVVPKALVYSIVINGILAWAMLVAMMFCMGDLEAALEATETLFYPFIEIFYQAVNSRAGAAIMTSIILVMGIASIVGVYAASSRMLWSFARDRGVPFHRTLVKVSHSDPLFRWFQRDSQLS
jgi:choline transport protein